MKKLLALAAFLIVCMSTSFANSIPTLDFAITPTDEGTVSYDGLGGPLVGFDIPVASVTGTNTAANNGVTVPILDGELLFETGSFIGSTADSWTFSPYFGIGIGVIGCADIDLDNDITCDDGDDSALLALGAFTANPTVTVSGSDFQISGAAGIDVKDPVLLSFFNAPDSLYTFNFNYSFTGSGLPPGAFIADSGGSGDFSNQPLGVPEPASLGLLAAGLLALCGLRKKLRP
jgi:hypothetical protein